MKALFLNDRPSRRVVKDEVIQNLRNTTFICMSECKQKRIFKHAPPSTFLLPCGKCLHEHLILLYPIHRCQR